MRPITAQLAAGGPIALLIAALAILLSRAGCADAGTDRTSLPLVTYEPLAYVELVDREIAPALEFCPLFSDPRLLGPGRASDLETELELVDSELQPVAPWSGASEADPIGCDCGDRRLSPLFCLRADVGPATADRIRRYARLSPLGEDLTAIDRWTLRAVGAEQPRLRLRPGVRRQRLPGGTIADRFEGDLLYRGSRARFALVDRAGNEHLLIPGAASDIAIGEWLSAQGRAERAQSPERLVHGLPLRLHHAGDAVRVLALPGLDDRLLIVAQQSRVVGLRIDGTRLDRDRRTVLALERDQELELELPEGRSLALRLVSRRVGELATLERTDAGQERRIDPRSGAEDLVRGLVTGMDGAVGRLGDAFVECAMEDVRVPGMKAFDVQPLARADVWLTLDQLLQGTATAALRRWAENGPFKRTRELEFSEGYWRSGDRLAPPPHLTLTIMDADSGELLALGTYPEASALREMLDGVAHLPIEPRRLLRDHLRDELERSPLQLRPHAIGSIFKPLIAWAAGTADRRLVDFTVPKKHATQWHADPRTNRLLEQCLISARVDEEGTSHFSRAYATTGKRGSCSGEGDGAGEDMCLALAVSDTYWFLELAARVLTLEHGRKLPDSLAAAATRDEAYGLAGLCGPQRVRNGPALCSGDAQRRTSELMPVACDGEGPLCRMTELLGVQLQAIGEANAPTSARAFLGGVPDLVDRLAGACDGCCPGLRQGGFDGTEPFRWIVPMPPQWSGDLLQSCTPDLEVFVEGGGVNYWNDVALTQALARLFTGRTDLEAKLVLDVLPGGAEQAEPACREPATSPPVTAKCGTDDARCRVLHGLSLAVKIGTLAALHDLDAGLSRDGATVTVRGKTGTTRAPYPSFVSVSEDDGSVRWERRSAARKSVLTTLLLEVQRDPKHARHFVVLLAIEGVGDRLPDGRYLTSVAGAVPFFAPTGPGYAILQQLVAQTVDASEGACP